MSQLPPLYHRGSVKNILGNPEDKELVFSYSNRYSVFDWGEMPDHIPQKGSCLAAMAYMFFDALSDADKWKTWSHVDAQGNPMLSQLKESGLDHHMSQGLVDEALSACPLQSPTPYLHVHKVDVHRPSFDGEKYDYQLYQERPTNALVPLEIIFRFGVPNGSSLMKRVNNEVYLAELGLDKKPNFGDIFSKPVIEYSTKLESTDVYIPFAQAKEMAGLTDTEAQNLRDLVFVLSLRLRDIFSASDLFLWDGKFEFAFSKERDAQGNRSFVLVDSIGPDELRLTYDGVQLSKECLRQPYRGGAWHTALEQAKKLGKERNDRDWKKICTDELGSQPENLNPQFIEQIAQLYKSLTNAIATQLYNESIFADAWTLEQVAETLRQKNA